MSLDVEHKHKGLASITLHKPMVQDLEEKKVDCTISFKIPAVLGSV